MTKDIKPECKVSIEHMQKDIEEIHEIVYKDGLMKQVILNTINLDNINKNMNKAVWLMVTLVAGFVGQFIWTLIQSQSP